MEWHPLVIFSKEIDAAAVGTVAVPITSDWWGWLWQWFVVCCSVSEPCLTLCNPMDCSMPGSPVLHYLLESAQIHVKSHWCCLTISSSAAPFSSCPQSFLTSGSSPVSRLFISGGQNIRASGSALFLPVNIQGWFPLGLSGQNGIIKISTNNKCWRGCREKGILLHCW